MAERDITIRDVNSDIAGMFQELGKQWAKDGLRPRDLFARMLRDHLAATAAQEAAQHA